MMLRYKATAIGELRESMSENMLRDELATALKIATGARGPADGRGHSAGADRAQERDEQIREDGGQHHITDEELVAMLATMAEQRLESSRRYEETGQLELAEREAEEIEIIRRFLPPQMDEEASELAIDQVIASSAPRSSRTSVGS